MQLERVEIDEADCFRWQAFPVTPLTAIFGANSTGKSTVLSVVNSLLSDSESRTGTAPPLTARLVMVPSQIDVPNHPDRTVLRDALAEAMLHPDGYWAERVGEFPPLLEGAPFDVVIATLTGLIEQAMRRWGVPIPRANELARQATANLCIIYDEHGARPAAAAIAADVSQLADSLYFGGPAQDSFGEAVASAVRDGVAHVPLLPSFATSRACERARPHLIVVSLEPTDLLGRLRSLVDQVHDRVFLGAKGVQSEGRNPGAEGGSAAGWLSDPWLETVPIAEEGARSPLSGPRPTNVAYRERDTYRWVLQQLSRRANELAPSFVTDRGHIELSMWAPHRWAQYPERVRVTLEEGGERLDLGRLGSGLARWVAASVRLACDDLITPIIRVTRDGVTQTVDAIPQGLLVGLASGLTRETVRIEPGNAAGVVLVDEPEAHLHPAAIRSVAEWLHAVSTRSLAVFVTTHHPILFEARTSLTTRLLVSRPHPELPMRIRDEAGFDALKPGGVGSEIRIMERDILGSLNQMSDEIGLTPGELFLLTQLCLFVEGPHDVAVLNAFGKATLDAAGIRVIPLHGADGAPALVSGEVVGQLGLRSCLVLDGGSPERVTRERKAANRLLEEARRYGWDMVVIQLEVPDILWWLDHDVCREIAPEFPGWSDAWTRYRAETKARRAKISSSDFKTWVIRTFGLQLSRDGVEDLAQRCRAADKIPDECKKLVHRVTGLAISGRDILTLPDEPPAPPSASAPPSPSPSPAGWSSPDLGTGLPLAADAPD